jgi:hypothetical protein
MPNGKQAFRPSFPALSIRRKQCLTDWGKMQAVASLIASDGPDSLSWNVDDLGNCVAAAQQGYSLAALQMLMPTKYWIARYGGGLADIGWPPPAGTYWEYGDYFANLAYAITEINTQTNYPSSIVLNDLKNAGAWISDFYPSKNGWNFNVMDGFLTSSMGGPAPNGAWKTDTLLTTIVNMSEYDFSVVLKANDGHVEGIGNSTQSLPAYASLDFASDHDFAGLSINVTILDPVTGASGAFFQLHLSDNFLGIGSHTWVDSQSTNTNFSIGTPIVQQAVTNLGPCYTCASVTVPVFYTSPAGLGRKV